MAPGDSFDCVRCERSQSYAPAGLAGGITEHEAEQVGWRQTEAGAWVCPFCCGNARQLRAVAEGRVPGIVARHAGSKP